MPSPDVSICIPAWEAERFIDRTLWSARRQTHRDVRILVSVDRGEDETTAICRWHAHFDDRIEVFAQRDRLGWSENCNFLLDHVDTDLFFLYFHDDVIDPTYTEKLRRALVDRPDASSTHCDLQYFGLKDDVADGNDYTGSPARRVINWLVGPVKGTLLRSLTRREVVADGLRFPNIGTSGFWRCQPYFLQLVASGPAVRVPEILYRRWIREGSLTQTWEPREPERAFEGFTESAKVCLELVDRLDADDGEREVARFCIYAEWMSLIRHRELRHARQATPFRPESVSPVFAAFESGGIPAAIDAQDADVQAWVLAAHGRLTRVTDRVAGHFADRSGTISAGRSAPE
jgi:glycosyltransferase involved in cell wall biosynthesis